MQVIESASEMQARAISLRAEGKFIGFVPTMGFLHGGHLSLLELAREKADIVVVSIFVNPTQFGPAEDLDKYPRDRERDLKLLQENGVDIVFAPAYREMYPEDFSTYITEEKLSQPLCGITRPVFFRGVCTVLAKLFNIVRPDCAVFGQKDAQQAAVVKRMVRDLNFPIEILVAPTIREEDGLAKSSRNTYLNEFERKDAIQIQAALQKGKALYDSGIDNVDRIVAEITHHISEFRRLRIIYVSVVDKDTMQPLRRIEPGRTLIAAAVWCDEVRLIDNIIL